MVAKRTAAVQQAWEESIEALGPAAMTRWAKAVAKKLGATRVTQVDDQSTYYGLDLKEAMKPLTPETLTPAALAQAIRTRLDEHDLPVLGTFLWLDHRVMAFQMVDVF